MGDGGEDVGGNQVEDGCDECMVMLYFLGGFLVLGNVYGIQGVYVDVGVGLEQVGQQQVDDDGDGGDDFEVDDGFQVDVVKFFCVVDVGDVDYQ